MTEQSEYTRANFTFKDRHLAIMDDFRGSLPRSTFLQELLDHMKYNPVGFAYFLTKLASPTHKANYQKIENLNQADYERLMAKKLEAET